MLSYAVSLFSPHFAEAFKAAFESLHVIVFFFSVSGESDGDLFGVGPAWEPFGLLEKFLEVGDEFLETNGPNVPGFELGHSFFPNGGDLEEQFSENFGHAESHQQYV